MLPRYALDDKFDDISVASKIRAAESKNKWKMIIGGALVAGLIAFIQIAPAIFAGAVAVASGVTTLGLSLIVGAFIGDVVSDVIPSRFRKPLVPEIEARIKWLEMAGIARGMKIDFINAFKPYNFALEQDEKRREWLQPVNGIKNFYNGLKQVAAIPFIALADLINNVVRSRSVGDMFVNLFLGLTIMPLAHLATGALTMFRGLTQVATTPLVYLDKLLRAGLTYLRDRPKSQLDNSIKGQLNNNFENNSENSFKGPIERRPSIQEILGEVEKLFNSSQSSEQISERLDDYVSQVQGKFYKAREGGQATNIKRLDECGYYNGFKIVAGQEKIRLAKDYFSLFSDSPAFQNSAELQQFKGAIRLAVSWGME